MEELGRVQELGKGCNCADKLSESSRSLNIINRLANALRVTNRGTQCPKYSVKRHKNNLFCASILREEAYLLCDCGKAT